MITCATGCTLRDEHSPACPCATTHDTGHEGHCRGCLPKPADVGRLCTRCRGGLERDVRTAPSIVDWIREHVEPSRQQALMQESTAKNPRPRTDSEGAFYMRLATKSRSAEGREPLAVTAVDDADGLHACLASWALLVLEEHPSALRATSPRGQWRSTDGTVVGLLPDSDATTSIAKFLTTHLDWCVEQPWIEEMVREIGREVRTLLARYPEAERARELTDARCQDCGRGPMIYYPPTWAHGPVTVQCEHCGAKVPEQNWEWYMKLVEEDRRAEKDAS